MEAEVIVLWICEPHANPVEVEQQGADIVQVRDGKVHKIDSYYRRAEALEAAGLRE